MEGEKKVSFAIRWRGANRGGGVHIKKQQQRIVKKDVDPYIFRVGIK